MTKAQQAEREQAAQELRAILKPGETVYTTLRHVSRSGMQRSIDVHVIQDNEPRWLSRLVARAIGFSFDEKREAVKVGGCGMDMGFHVVYELSHRLYPDGFGCIGQGPEHKDRCPSNDHSNGDRDYTLYHEHKDGGYALRHRWM